MAIETSTKIAMNPRIPIEMEEASRWRLKRNILNILTRLWQQVGMEETARRRLEPSVVY